MLQHISQRSVFIRVSNDYELALTAERFPEPVNATYDGASSVQQQQQQLQHRGAVLCCDNDHLLSQQNDGDSRLSTISVPRRRRLCSHINLLSDGDGRQYVVAGPQLP